MVGRAPPAVAASKMVTSSSAGSCGQLLPAGCACCWWGAAFLRSLHRGPCDASLSSPLQRPAEQSGYLAASVSDDSVSDIVLWSCLGGAEARSRLGDGKRRSCDAVLCDICGAEGLD